MLTNCVNCGAPLHSHVCEYCGTEYPREKASDVLPSSVKVDAVFGSSDSYGTVKIGNQTFECYLGKMEAEVLYSSNAGRTMDGTLHRSRPIATKHKFTLIER